MALIHHIERLRQKPDHVKHRIALFTSLGITLVIFAVWVVSWNIQSNLSVAVETNVGSPASSLTANISDAWTYIKGLFQNTNSSQYQAASAIQAVPGNSQK